MIGATVDIRRALGYSSRSVAASPLSLPPPLALPLRERQASSRQFTWGGYPTDLHQGRREGAWDITDGAWMALTEQQFAAVVASYAPTLRRVLLRLTHGRSADADDLLQRTFERAWLKRETFLGGEVEPWIRGIARFEHLNHLRHRGQQLRLKEKVLSEAKLTAPIFQPPLVDSNLPMEQCLERLGELDRRIVDIFYGRTEPGPLTDREIGLLLTQEAKAAGEGPELELGKNPGKGSGKHKDLWSVDRVRTRRHRAIKDLRRCMKAQADATKREQSS